MWNGMMKNIKAEEPELSERAKRAAARIENKYIMADHGLMSAIIALTAPPPNPESGNKSKQEKAGGQKKTTRTQPKEACCEGCGEIGDFLLTCTDCNTNYHPVCDDPPLDEDDVKDMEWQCRSCRNKRALKEQIASIQSASKLLDKMPTLVRIDCPVEPTPDYAERKLPEFDRKEIEGELDVEMEDAEAAVRPGGSQQKNDSDQNKEKNVQKVRSIFSNAITNAKTINPTPFEIPQNYHINQHNFPGTSRSLVKKSGGVKLKPTIVDLESYCVPKPLSVCYQCGRSCRPAPLLKCDYCPKYFHFDCLNPPLTAPPVGLWICPLHTEPIMETKLLKTTQLSQRVRLWDLTHKQVDRQAVVLQFLKKCSRKNPPFGRKVKLPASLPYEVPPGEGHFPLNAGTESDSLISFMDKEKLMQNMDTERKQQLYKCYEETLETMSSSDLHEETSTFSKVETEDLIKRATSTMTDEEVPADPTDENVPNSSTVPPTPDVIELPSENDSVNLTTTETLSRSPGPSSPLDLSGIDILLEAAEVVKCDDPKRRMEYLKTLSIEKVYELAAQQLQAIDLGLSLNSMGSGQQNTAPQVPRNFATPIRRTSRPSERVTYVKHTLQLFCVNSGKVLKFGDYNITFGERRSADRHITYFNPRMVVNCTRISDRHAVLFFDRLHKRWEILNYSPFGLLVDQKHYVLNPGKDEEEDPKNDLEAMKAEILKHRKVLVEKRMNARLQELYGNRENECPCMEEIKSTTLVTIDNEGSAILVVGSEIQIGCMKLVVKSMDVEEETVGSKS